jgi:hypothetical protein
MRADANINLLAGAGPHFSAAKPLPLLRRFGSKLALDVFPAVLASVIGGILFTHFQLGRVAPAPAEQASAASAEVLALVRDEHDAIIGYLKSQMAAEKDRLAAQDAETARAVAEAKAHAAEAKAELEAREKASTDLAAADIKLASASSARAGGASAPQPKFALPRPKPNAVAAPRALVAQAGQQPVTPATEQRAGQNVSQTEGGAAVLASNDRLARDPDSLLAKTLDLKDQVVAATRNAVTAIGDAFASVGERLSGGTPNARQFSSDS